ncbi:MAG TPA: hypothetical protein VJT73_08715 [Polyangiaceae bacterium]|nr:hypothetical protein [Polyangiaceae bacterium]
MSKSPAAIVKEQFGDKEKLVAALSPLTSDDLWVNRVNETKGLSRVSNAKLLHLFNVLSAVKQKFGSRVKLVDAICDLEKRTKDEGFKKRLLAYPVPRLYDHYRASARRAGVKVDGSATTLRSGAAPAKGADKSAEPKAKKAADKAPVPAAKAAPKKK